MFDIICFAEEPRLSSLISIILILMQYNVQICSLSTIVREYVALRSISYLPFKDLILTAAESNQSSEDRAWKISRPLTEFIESNHNLSQLEAIRVSVSQVHALSFLLNLN